MKQEILHIMPIRLRKPLEKTLQNQPYAEEIRIRVGQLQREALRLASGKQW